MIYRLSLRYLPAKVSNKVKKPTEKVEIDGIQWILMGHQCHQGSVATPAPQPLGQFLCSIVRTWSQYTPLRCQTKVSFKISGVSQNGRERPQKGNRHPFGLQLGHYHPWWRGDKVGNPLKVNISWFMALFPGFYHTITPPAWIFLDFWRFFSDFMGPTLQLLVWNGPNPRLGPHLRDGKSWLNLCNIPYGECSCDRSHLIYRDFRSLAWLRSWVIQ